MSAHGTGATAARTVTDARPATFPERRSEQVFRSTESVTLGGVEEIRAAKLAKLSVWPYTDGLCDSLQRTQTDNRSHNAGMPAINRDAIAKDWEAGA